MSKDPEASTSKQNKATIKKSMKPSKNDSDQDSEISPPKRPRTDAFPVLHELLPHIL
jgi:hypothetical protein